VLQASFGAEDGEYYSCAKETGKHRVNLKLESSGKAINRVVGLSM
jgi:hypothetical protein